MQARYCLSFHPECGLQPSRSGRVESKGEDEEEEEGTETRREKDVEEALSLYE